MNKISLTICLLLFFTSIAYSQKYHRTIPTTIEEYNYLTKGYRIQVESGLDMKKGYKLDDLGNKKVGVYNFDLKSLVRDSSKEVAAILVIAHSPYSGKDYYLCIPHGNFELINKYWESLNEWDRQILLAYSQFISTVLGTEYATLMAVKDQNEQIINKSKRTINH